MNIQNSNISSVKYDLVCKLLDEAVFVLHQTHKSEKTFRLCKCNIKHVLNFVNNYICGDLAKPHVHIRFSTDDQHVMVYVNASFVLKRETIKWGLKQA